VEISRAYGPGRCGFRGIPWVIDRELQLPGWHRTKYINSSSLAVITTHPGAKSAQRQSNSHAA
jgi:hypothetical protein